LGKLGELSEELETELVFWRVVIDAGISPRELNECTMRDIYKMESFLNMRSDYSDALLLLPTLGNKK